MKKYSIHLLICLSTLLFSCTSEKEKAIKLFTESISEFASPDTITHIEIIDTVSLSHVDSSLEVVNNKLGAYDTLILSFNNQIESTEQRLASSDSTLKALKFEMLRPIWEQTIQQDKNTLMRLKLNLAEAEKHLGYTRIKSEFLTKAKTNAVDDVAYYKIKGHTADSYLEYFVSPSGKVLNEKPKAL